MIKSLTERYIIILYDGECGFCNHWVRWILGHRPSEKMRFVALQSDTGKEILHHHNLAFDLSSIIVVHQEKAYQKSQAISFILKNLNSPLKHIQLLLRITPTFIADSVYNLIARYRYRISGKTDTCEIPSAEERKFFL